MGRKIEEITIVGRKREVDLELDGIERIREYLREKRAPKTEEHGELE